MCKALETIQTCNQHFPAPDAAIRSVASAIEAQANHRILDAVLRHAARDVRVVMLHGDEREFALSGPAAGSRSAS